MPPVTRLLPDTLDVVIDGQSGRYVRTPEPAPRFAPLHGSAYFGGAGEVTVHVDLDTDRYPFGRVVIIPEEDWQP
jgi:hypothetical protein